MDGVEIDESQLEGFFEFLSGHLDEKQRRLLAGGMARLLGHGGPTRVAEASGMSRNTVIAGTKAFDVREEPSERVRAEGGGRPRLLDADPGLLADLERLVEPDSRGDPMSPLRWTLKSTRQLAKTLNDMGHQVSYWMVGFFLREELGYSLQGTAKTVEGAQHGDRNAQFEYINMLAAKRLRVGLPVISVDCKKKEQVSGVKANGGQEWQPKGQPERVEVHDFPDPKVPKASPYGVFDIGANEGWVSVGDDHDTPAFAVNAIRRWWEMMGRDRYPRAKSLMVTADAGGSNSYRAKAWKKQLGELAEETGLKIIVCHFPPGTSKWNRIEHRMFSFITRNWRGRPLTSYQVVVDLIASTTTETGLRILAEWDRGEYPLGVKVTDEELAALNLKRHKWHPDWNYDLKPTRQTNK